MLVYQGLRYSRLAAGAAGRTLPPTHTFEQVIRLSVRRSYDLASQVLLEVVLEVGKIDRHGTHAASGLAVCLSERNHLANLAPETFWATGKLGRTVGLGLVRPTAEGVDCLVARKSRRPFAVTGPAGK
jgi:hypothetical protein